MVIEMTTIDMETFARFKQHQALFKTLIEAGCFDVHGGRVTLHFDGDGELRKVEKEEIVFKK